ncbi:MAG: transglycosylase domain-containing protein [Verrucomicrobiales bacterium]|jgi:penicillin-binding protein 1A|nr:transglycosylase domain-containing protein [Verrucomicrobiales bacterium]
MSRQLSRSLWLWPLLLIISGGAGALVAVGLRYQAWAARFDLTKVSQMPSISVIYDREGRVIQRLYEQNRILVDRAQIPDLLCKAVVAKEDERFFQHGGFDLIAISRALLHNIAGKKVSSGASTITQQLARNSAEMFDRTYDRKIKEIFLAMRIESRFSKEEILTYYLNRIFFGGNIYGVGAAADAYFGKQPKDLNLPESALLAGIIAGPNSFSPWRNPVRAKAARAKVLQRMVSAGFITQQAADAGKAEPLKLRPLAAMPGSYVTFAVLNHLPPAINQETLYRGGLKIHTSIDLDLQRAAEQKIETGLAKIEQGKGYRHVTRAAYLARAGADSEEPAAPPYLQAAFVAIHNRDGGVLAIVGGRNFDESPFNRALLASRQVGSTVKPFVYANAFNILGYSAFTLVDRSAFDLKNPAADAVPAGLVPDFISAREALRGSDNYAAMRTGLAAGVDNFCYLFKQAADVDAPPYPSSLLGACDATPLQLTAAFTIFPNDGILRQVWFIDRIENFKGEVLYRHQAGQKMVLSPQIAFQISDLLRGVVDDGTAAALRRTFNLKGDLGGKTGTTNDYKDAWFVGYTSEITAGLWVGLDRPQTIMPGGYASRLAVPVWGGIMNSALSRYPSKPMPPPPGLTLTQLKTEQTAFFFFKSTSISARSEYLRDDQLSNGFLPRLDGSITLNDGAFTVSGTSALPPKKKSWFDSLFEDDGEEEPGEAVD